MDLSENSVAEQSETFHTLLGHVEDALVDSKKLLDGYKVNFKNYSDSIKWGYLVVYSIFH